MLGALIRQAQHVGLVVEPGFAPKEIRWMAHIAGNRFTGAVPLSDGRKGMTFAQCPEMGQPELMALPRALGKPQAAHFLADTCGVVALLPAVDREGQPKTDANSQAELAKYTEKHPTYLDLLSRASADVEQIHAILTVLQDPEQMERLRADLIRQGAKPSDKLSFTVGDLDLLNSPIWHDWWRSFRRETLRREPGGEGGGMLDFTSGEPVMPANTHPKLTKLGVGAIAMGASLVGYDKEAFSSYNLDAGANGAVSEENAAAYRAALDKLLDQAPVLGQMKVAAWFDHREAEGQALIDALTNPISLAQTAQGWEAFDETEKVQIIRSAAQREASARERARTLLTAIRKGEAPDTLNAQYFALAISGASGRAMVRDWKTGSLESLAEAVVTWFDDMAVTMPGGRLAGRPKFMSLLLGVQRPKGKETKLDDYLKPIRNLQLPLWRAALDPRAPIPLSAVVRIMESHRAEVTKGDFTQALSKEGSPLARSRVYARMGLLRAYHQRLARTAGGPMMTPNLNPEHPSPAYHCGRLMYLLAELQKKSAGEREVNAGVIQRYYGSASATPNLVLGRLIALSQHHLNKLTAGYAYWWQGQLGQTLNAIKDELPRTLTPADQSLFALGYYHQLVFSRSRRSGNPEPDTDIPTDAADTAALTDTAE